jgi:hypothetical protein
MVTESERPWRPELSPPERTRAVEDDERPERIEPARVLAADEFPAAELLLNVLIGLLGVMRALPSRRALPVAGRSAGWREDSRTRSTPWI